MADKTLPPEGLSGGAPIKSDERRAFLRRAIGVGVPVVLATVRGRSVLAQTPNDTVSGSGCASIHPSGWLSQGRSTEEGFDLAAREESCLPFQEPGATGVVDPGATDALAPPADPIEAVAPDPLIDPSLPPPPPPPPGKPGQGKGRGKGGGKK
jgi:hypothetical protein